mmetsp:Transcript_48517/g.152459  ORF Transcript_48517/g.152459 Transcript_48517/m.152459 type:complete len:110 (-) Transcript_48517:128-457(-)
MVLSLLSLPSSLVLTSTTHAPIVRARAAPAMIGEGPQGYAPNIVPENFQGTVVPTQPYGLPMIAGRSIEDVYAAQQKTRDKDEIYDPKCKADGKAHRTAVVTTGWGEME